MTTVDLRRTVNNETKKTTYYANGKRISEDNYDILYRLGKQACNIVTRSKGHLRRHYLTVRVSKEHAAWYAKA